MRAVIFGYFGTLTDPGAEEYREPLAHRTGELLGVCRPRFWEALAGSFGERTIGVHGGTESTLRAVARSCGANPSSAQLAVALAHHRSGHARLRKPRHHALGVLAVKTWAMRGTLHLLRPTDAGAYLSLVETTRFWLKPSWQRVSGVTPRQIDELTEKVAVLLDAALLSRDELVTQIVADKRFSGLEERLRSGWGQVLKPLAWRGVLCHGPNQGNKVTFTLPASRFPNWGKMPDPDEAAPAVI